MALYLASAGPPVLPDLAPVDARLVAVTSPPSRAGRYCRALLMTCLSNDSHIWPWGASAKGLDAQRPSDDIGG
ncbi:hypothetical protein Q8A67_023799 [Cirrhinus molitorella]|uniref:Uncharacterized protein n=1 Tax=Cirrhinus molitorella TaxID=172907 RepID=A0AA88PEJ3_9TELE|nr:hypothetical protein Q8A67_023799 [Cirrhinus molitorella]